jgi:hypothetical protein
MDKETLLLPPYLQSLGYATFPQVRELSDRAMTVTADAIQHDIVWSPWRGIFEYVCCVEYAREMLKALPTGPAIGSVNVVPARYHSASLVFFAQATLDNVAVWASRRLNLDVKGSDCALHKSKFNQALAARTLTVAASVQHHAAFIAKLKSYRQEWIHRLSGGALVFSDKSSSEPGAKIEIMVPINPSVGQFEHDPKAYVRAVERTRTNNGGRWLYPVAEFADELTNGLKGFLLAFLAAALADQIFSAK